MRELPCKSNLTSPTAISNRRDRRRSAPLTPDAGYFSRTWPASPPRPSGQLVTRRRHGRRGGPRRSPPAAAIPIIDTHIHLFDPTRPQGAPYTGHPDAGPPQPALPPRYRALASPLGIVGAIKVEASPWVEDNLWVLEVAERDTIVVGVIGNLEPDKPDFGEMLGALSQEPALSRHPLRQPLGTRHHEAGRTIRRSSTASSCSLRPIWCWTPPTRASICSRRS